MLSLEQAPFNIVDVVDSVQSDLSRLAEDKGIGLSVEIEEPFSASWLGDLVRVRQFVLNLASNAVKFTERGAVTIKLSIERFEEFQAIELEVIDTGIVMNSSSTP
jgi:signal transduction histidine kinase